MSIKFKKGSLEEAAHKILNPDLIEEAEYNIGNVKKSY